ncbi:MAG: hypothetical protein FWC39_00355 [Bacteroidetes bacterium]|nr:hypothetical protein [Bacteroidota bacterium]
MQNGTKEFFMWILVNLILPIALPVAFALVASIVANIFDYSNGVFFVLANVLKMLFLKGIYLFLGITLLLSLLQDNSKETKIVFNGFFYLIFYVLLFISSFIFISGIGIITGGRTIEDNKEIHLITIALCVIAAIGFKIQLIINKKKYLSYGIV